MQNMIKLINHPVFRWLIAIIPTVILTVLLLQPEAQPIIPTGIQTAPPSLKRELFFSSMHLICFSITALLWCFALNIKLDSKRMIVILCVFLLMYGCSMEYMQTNIPGRSAQWWDMLANSIGIIGGCFLWFYFQKQINSPDIQMKI